MTPNSDEQISQQLPDESHSQQPPFEEDPDKGQDLTTLVYILQALSFFFGVTMIAAVMINYIKQDEVRGGWLESHFRWQIRTFWFSLLWLIIGIFTSFFLIGYLILGINSLWLLYRILRGYLCLRDKRPMYQDA